MVRVTIPIVPMVLVFVVSRINASSNHWKSGVTLVSLKMVGFRFENPPFFTPMRCLTVHRCVGSKDGKKKVYNALPSIKKLPTKWELFTQNKNRGGVYRSLSTDFTSLSSFAIYNICD